MIAAFSTGCTSTRVVIRGEQPPTVADQPTSENRTRSLSAEPRPEPSTIELTSGSERQNSPEPDQPPVPPSPDEASALPAGPTQPIALEQVVDSIYQAFPLLQVALLDRNVATGDNVSAMGEFDLKLKGETANTPEGFYQTYRNAVGFDQPLMGGGSVFGGYRLGRGSFEPWYLERQTNDGGEFKLGLSVPLWQNRTIDERRAQLWRTAYGRNLVEPEIQAQLLAFVRDGSIAYWEWMGAGMQFQYAEELLRLAQDRDGQLRQQVEQGDVPESDLTDNQRLIVSRRVKRLDALRKQQTSAAKLSLYLRLVDGSPFVPPVELLPKAFPEPQPIEHQLADRDVAYAQTRRPELQALDIVRQQLDVDLCQAQNLLQPELNAVLANSQDVGGPTSSKKDKSPYELEAGLFLTVPAQRRKARGKVTALEGKLAQLSAKRQFTADKIAVEVRSAIIALDTAFAAIGQAREAVRLNEEMQRFELIRLEQGASDFLRLNLREQATFDARVAEIETLVRYFEALAQYNAAIAANLPAL